MFLSQCLPHGLCLAAVDYSLTPSPPLAEMSGSRWPSSFSNNGTLASEALCNTAFTYTIHCRSALSNWPQKPQPGKKSLLLGLRPAWGAQEPSDSKADPSPTAIPLKRPLPQHISKLGQYLEGLEWGYSQTGRGKKGRDPYLLRQIWVWILFCCLLAHVHLQITEAL